jgi:hypothetical protein
MHRRIGRALCAAVLLLGCGQEAGESKERDEARGDEAGPIERELRRTLGGEAEGSEEAHEGATARRSDAPHVEEAEHVEGVEHVGHVGHAEHVGHVGHAEDALGARGRRAAASAAGSDGSGARAAVRPEEPAAASEDRAREDARPEPSAAEAAAPAPAAVAEAEEPPDGAAAEPDAADAASEPPPVELARVVVARDVEGREPVGAAPFADDVERVYLFVEARNDGPEGASLAVEWIGPEGTRGRPIALEVPVAPRWRTWATTRRVQGRPGRWTVVVRSAERELARRAFEVRPAPGGDEA